MNDVKQVIVIRKDLNMRRGEESAQVAHASMKVFLDKLFSIQKIVPLSDNKKYYYEALFKLNQEMKYWIFDSSATKIVAFCNSEDELIELKENAEENNIIYALIRDNEFTELKKICDCLYGDAFKENFILHPNTNKIFNCNKCNNTGKVNKPTYTALAIGPDFSDKIDKIIGHLKLRQKGEKQNDEI